jgi:hypothetical protein
MDQIAIEYGRERCGPPRPRRPRPETIWTPGQRRVCQAIEAAFAVGREELCATTRGRCNIALARQTGMYLARVALGMTLSDAGLMFGRDRTTAAHACRLLEDLRDDPSFDALLEAMEAFVLNSEEQSGSGRR